MTNITRNTGSLVGILFVALAAGCGSPGMYEGPVSAPPAGARVELFDGYQFDGRTYPVNGTVTNFSDVGFNDRAQSMIIRDGSWEVCEHADFRGACQTYGPGRHPNLGVLAGRISSIRPSCRQSRHGNRRLGHGLARIAVRRPQSLRAFVRDRQRGGGEPRQYRVQRPRSVVARRGRLLDILQRRQFPRRMPDVRSRRLPDAAVGTELQDFLRSARPGQLSVHSEPNWQR